MQHADDDFLADVAALRQADRALLDAGLERDRVLVHVLAEHRAAGLDAADFGDLAIRQRTTPAAASALVNALACARPTTRSKPRHAEIVAAHDRDRRAVPSRTARLPSTGIASSVRRGNVAFSAWPRAVRAPRPEDAELRASNR